MMPTRIALMMLMLAGVFSFTAPSATASGDDAAWRSAFLNDAPKAWAAYKTKSARLRGSLAFHMTMSERSDLDESLTYQFKQRPGCASFVEQDSLQRGKPQRGSSARVSNPDYSFVLKRSGPERPWIITDLRFPEDKPVGTSAFAQVDRWVNCPINYALMFGDLGLLPTDPGFSVSRVTRESSSSGQDLVKVFFSFDSRVNEQNSNRIPSIEGWVVYDPHALWVIRQYDTKLHWLAAKRAGHCTGTLTYRLGEDGFPFFKSARATYHSVGKANVFQYTYNMKAVEDQSPASEFTLSAFGLPEPGKRTHSRTWFIAASLVGFCFLGLAGWMGWRARRRVLSQTP